MCSSTWRLWHTRLQQQQDLYILEDQALNQQGLALQKKVNTSSVHSNTNLCSIPNVNHVCVRWCLYCSFFAKTWLQWRERYTAACCQKENKSKALLHFILTLKRKVLHQWMNYVSCCHTERKSQGRFNDLPAIHTMNVHPFQSFVPTFFYYFPLDFFRCSSACLSSPPGEGVLGCLEKCIASQVECGASFASSRTVSHTDHPTQSTGEMESLYPNQTMKSIYISLSCQF